MQDDQNNINNQDGANTMLPPQSSSPPSPPSANTSASPPGGPVAPNPQFGNPAVAPVQPNTSGVNPDFQKQRNIVIAVAVALIVVVFAIGGFLTLNRDSDSPSQPSQSDQTNAPVLSRITAINKLDEKYGKNTIAQKEDQASSLENEKTALYANFDDSTAYFLENSPSERRYYVLDNIYNYSNIFNSTEECAKFIANNQDKLTTIINIFKDNDFAYRQPRDADGGASFYSKLDNCSQGGMYVSKEYICSTRFDAIVRTDNEDGTSEVVPSIAVACSSVEELSSKMALAKLSKQIYLDTNQPSGSILPLPNYVKDSASTGYKIAEISAGTASSYYYKKGDYGWQKIQASEGGLACDVVRLNPDALAAFKGQECYDQTTMTKKIL